jgi:hypothetical protein
LLENNGENIIAPRGFIGHAAPLMNPTALSASQSLPLFLASLSGMAEEEIKSAKGLWLRNAICEYTAAQTKARGQLWGFSLLWIVPWCWPMIYSARQNTKADLLARRQSIDNALHAWRKDLAGETFDWPPVG